jgi:hypothetical protein
MLAIRSIAGKERIPRMGLAYHRRRFGVWSVGKVATFAVHLPLMMSLNLSNISHEWICRSESRKTPSLVEDI